MASGHGSEHALHTLSAEAPTTSEYFPKSQPMQTDASLLPVTAPYVPA